MKFSKFFSNLQGAPWYRQFLNPVMDEIEINNSVLDIGTGPAKMLQFLASEKNITGFGIDTNEDMLNEAKVNLKNTEIQIQKIEPNEKLNFQDESFDKITICNLLFHLNPVQIESMLDESFRTLKKGGKIIVLTPTGAGNVLKLSVNYFSIKNTTMLIWYRSTKRKSKIWTKELYLKSYTEQRGIPYQKKIFLNGFAQIEMLQK